jgi:hypothetical protein
VREEANYPDISGEAAIDGTGSHLLLELCLTENQPALAYLDSLIGVNDPEKPGGWMVDRERCDRVQMCLDYITRRVTELETNYPDADIAVESETKSNPGEKFGRDDWWGTVDVTITVTMAGKVHFIEVVDYKDGSGWVHVEGNTQLISYLGGKAPDIFDLKCRMTIVQPKTQPPVRYADIVWSELNEELVKLASAAEATDDPEAPLTCGNHCQWCKHKPNCTVQTEGSIEIMSQLIPIKDLNILIENPGQLPSSQLSKILSAKEGIMTAFDKVAEEIQRRIEAGDDVPGWAMVPGNSRRIWNCSEAEVEKALRSRRLKDADIYVKSIVSPAQCMKIPQLTDKQKQTIEKELITTIAGKLTLKKVSRKQKTEAAEMFAEVAQPQPISFF